MYRPIRPSATTAAIGTSVVAAAGLPMNGVNILLLFLGPLLMLVGFLALRGRIQAKAADL